MTIKHTLIIIPFFFLCNFSVQAQCWNLVWEDEFNGSSLNESNWSYQIGNSGWGNNELQYYTDLSSNVDVNNGVLEITAKEESFMGADYTSARIRSINQGDWTYGKMEARIKLPIGQGIWPAFWMMPTNSEYGGWPASGEIDIMEFLGHQPAITYGTLHYGYEGNHQYMGISYTLPSGTFSGSFHDFTVEWEEDKIRWYVDGNLYQTITEADLGSYPWVFDQDFHFILNVAVGGNWPGSPDGSTSFPQTMEVDYVRVYQLLTDLAIDGDDYVQPEDVKSYALPSISGASYNWSVPGDAIILSGQSTNEISLDWGLNSGTVSCHITTSCGTETIDFPVTVSTNYFENPAFEFDYNNWNTWTYNGASADFSINTDAPQEGLKSAQVTVTNGGSNNWDVQLQRSGFSLEAGEDYTLTFYAKTATPGAQIPIAVIKNQPPWNFYAGMTITLSGNWEPYELNFTASTTDDVLMNLDLGNSLETFHFDNFVFEKTSAPLPVELGPFSVKETANENVLLEWITYSEIGNAYFDILRSSDNHSFRSIGRVNGQGDKSQQTNYRYEDDPEPGTYYYQLKQVDFDGQYSLSPIRAATLRSEKEVILFPNPAAEIVRLVGWNGGQLRLFDSNGKIVFQQQFEQNQLNYDFSLGNFPKGTYFLALEGKNELLKLIH